MLSLITTASPGTNTISTTTSTSASSTSSNTVSSKAQQQQVITPNVQGPLIKASVLRDDRQNQQQHQSTPSLVVSVPLSTANVPGVNLPTNSNANILTSNSNNNMSSAIVSPSHLSNIYQQLPSRTNEQLAVS